MSTDLEQGQVDEQHAVEHTVRYAPSLDQVVQATEEQRRLFKAQADQMKLQTDLQLAEIMATAGVFDHDKKLTREQAKARAFAKIRIGEDLRLAPAESLMAINFGERGEVIIDIHTRVAMALRDGRYRYDILQLNDSTAEIQWFRKENGAWKALKPESVAIDQLRAIKVWENGKQINLAERWNYRDWREDMLYRFVQIRNIRRHAPETQGSYAPHAEETQWFEDAGVRPGGPDLPQEVEDAFDSIAPDGNRGYVSVPQERDSDEIETALESPVSEEKPTDGDPETFESVYEETPLSELDQIKSIIKRQLAAVKVARIHDDAKAYTEYDWILKNYKGLGTREAAEKCVSWLEGVLRAQEQEEAQA